MTRHRRATRPGLAMALLGCALAACTTPSERGNAGQASPDLIRPAQAKPAPVPVSQLLKRPGGYYTDDAPDGRPPVDLDRVADAVPRAEPLNPGANQPYTVFGRDYQPLPATAYYKRQGSVSWYGRKFHGQRTASGEVYDMFAMTAAHPTLPVPSYARVTNLENGRSVVVRVNDRGPYHSGRIADLSYAAAWRLGFADSAVATVEIESILAAGPAQAPAAAEAPDPVPVIAVASEARGIFLQLGAFGTLANAEAFRTRVLAQLGALAGPAGAQLGIRSDPKLHRLQLGPYRDRAAAAQAAERVRELLDLKPIVVVR